MEKLIGFLYILLCNFVGNLIIELTGLPFPGSVLGLLMMLTLLVMKIVKLEQVEATSTLLISLMLVFILPGAVKMMDVLDKFAGIIPQVVLVGVVSVLLCILSSAYVAKLAARFKDRHQKAGKA